MSNLVTNGDFSSGFTDWGTSGGVALDNTIFNSASPSVVMDTGGTLSHSSIPTTDGLKYILVFYVRYNTLADTVLELDINGNTELLTPTVTGSFGLVSRIFIAPVGTSTISFNNVSTGSKTLWIDDVYVAQYTNCYSGESLARCLNTETNKVVYLPVKNINSKKYHVYSVNQKKYIPILHNVLTGPTARYYVIKKDSLGENKPSKDFYITSGHVIVLNNVEIKARNVPDAELVRSDPPDVVYTICTENREPIEINNLSVMSWSAQEWYQYADERHLPWDDHIKE